MTILPRTILLRANNISHFPRDLTELWVGWRICKSWWGSLEEVTWLGRTLEEGIWLGRTWTTLWATSGSSRRKGAGQAMAIWWVQTWRSLQVHQYFNGKSLQHSVLGDGGVGGISWSSDSYQASPPLSNNPPPLEIIRPPLVEFYHPQSKLDCAGYMCCHNTTVHSTRSKHLVYKR